ncbi:MAG: hypothetical protein AB7U20_19370 [Planctomycetaceae bacterium]
MRRVCVTAMFGLGMLLMGAGESQAGCCLFGWLFPCCQPQTCCYAPPPCCPTACGTTSCGYAPAPCSSCGSCGACATGCCGTGCAGGDCGVTYEAAPSSAMYAPAPALFPRLAGRGFFQPAIVTSPRYPVQTTSRVIEPAAAYEVRVRPAEKERRETTNNSSWEPVGVVR